MTVLGEAWDLEMFPENKPLALLMGMRGAQADRLPALADMAGWRSLDIGASFDWPGDHALLTPPELILCLFQSETETPEREIARAAQYAADHGTAFILWTDFARLDLAAALASMDAVLLVDPDPAEAVFALTRARAKTRASAREDRGESRELMRLSDELVDMARRVAALTQGGGSDGGGKVRADPLAYRGAPGGGGTTALGKPPALKAATIREMIRLRRMREDMFESDLFADPAWDMLLDLMASRLEDKPVSVSSLCIASAVPPTTALRWIKLMTDRGLLERRADTADARRIFIALSDETAARLQGLLAAMIGSKTPAV